MGIWRRCRCFGWHGELLIVHHHWQHSYWRKWAQYLCLCLIRRQRLLLGNDPHRRLWHSQRLPGAPPSTAAIATAITPRFATSSLAAALTSITLAASAFATASLTATTFATTLATTLATTAFATTFASRSHPHPRNRPPQRPHGHHLCRQRAD